MRILGCPERAAVSSQKALDAYKLIQVLRAMEQQRFYVSLPSTLAEHVYEEILKIFGVNEKTIKIITNASLNTERILAKKGVYIAPDNTEKRSPPQILRLPESLTISDFEEIPATQERFYQRLAAYRKNMGASYREELGREIKVIHTIMDEVVGVEQSKIENMPDLTP